MVLERNQDYFQDTLTNEYETVNDPTNNELSVIKVSLIKDDTRKEWEKKDDTRKEWEKKETSTIGSSFKTFGKSDLVTEKKN